MTITLVHDQRYAARPSKSHGPIQTKNGEPRYVITFDLYEDGKPSGVTLDYSGQLEGQYSDNTFETLKTCGAQGEDVNALTLDYSRDVSVKARSREYNGKTYWEARFVDPARRTLDPAKAGSLSERLRAALGTPAPATEAPKAAPFGANRFGAKPAPAPGAPGGTGNTPF